MLESVNLRRETLAYSDRLWAEVEPIWRRLLGATETSAFLTIGWIASWMAVFGPEIRPSALIWRTGKGDPVGCVLLSVGAETFGPFEVSCAYLNATAVPNVSSEHNDVLVLPEYRRVVLEDIVRTVRERKTDRLGLVGMRDTTATQLREYWPGTSVDGYVSEAPYVALDRLRATRTAYVRCLSSSARWQVRRSMRLYRARFGHEAVEVAAPGSQAREWFADLVSLHEDRWRGKGEPGAFHPPAVRAFHERLLERAPPSDDSEDLLPQILRIRFGNEAIGYLYALSFRGRVSFYQSGVKYHADNRLKPGMVTHALVAEHLLQSGAVEYDFLGGESGPVRYKRVLSTDVRQLAWFSLPAPTVKMQALAALRSIASGVRRRNGRALD